MGVQTLPNSILKTFSETCDLIRRLYEEAIQALISNDLTLADHVLDIEPDFEELWNLCLKANQNSQITSLTFSYMHRIIDNLTQIRQYADKIAEITIDRAEAQEKKAD